MYYEKWKTCHLFIVAATFWSMFHLPVKVIGNFFLCLHEAILYREIISHFMIPKKECVIHFP